MFRNFSTYNNYPPINPQQYGQQMPMGQSPQMQQSMGQPMQPQPLGTLPPLYPNFEQQNVSPFPHYNQMQAQYAQGGHVGLGDLAEIVRNQGEGEDTVLAHINAEEANLLARKFGGDINPRTGLPQYGFGKALRKVFRQVPFVGPVAAAAAAPIIGREHGHRGLRDFIPGAAGAIPAGLAYGQIENYLSKSKSEEVPQKPIDASMAHGVQGAGPLQQLKRPALHRPQAGQQNRPFQRVMRQFDPSMFAPENMGREVDFFEPYELSDGGSVEYAHGGNVGISDLAELIRGQGEAPDNILAHLQPNQAKMLEQTSGGDINPETGLPQYGLKLKKLLKQVLPIAGAAVGTYFGGPTGGAIGGGIGSALSGSKKNRFKNALVGAGLGYVGGSMAGQGFANVPGLAGTGINLGQNAGRAGAMNSLRGLGASGGSGGLSGLLGSNKLTLGLLGLGAAGKLFGKDKVPHERALNEQMALSGIPRAEMKLRPSEPYRRKLRPFDPAMFAPENMGREHQWFEDEEPYVYHMADGGYLAGHTGGQADEIPAKLSDGEYVIDASSVSDLGDGNNAAGAKKLDEMVQRLRAHKRTSGKKLPPKAKGLSHYLKAKKIGE